jgi:sec-independent protein translocase protein TatA
MGSLSIWHWLVVVLVVMLLFSRGAVSRVMTDIGQGIRQLRKISEEDKNETPSA